MSCFKHFFPAGTSIEIPERFTDPFRYVPHPLVIKASEEILAFIDGSPELRSSFSEGKMLGVLVVDSPVGYLAAFSGSAGGRSMIPGFVPPIFDLLDPSGHFKSREAEITTLNHHISSLESSGLLSELKKEMAEAESERDSEINAMKARMAISKRERDEIRSEVSDPSRWEMLIRESQFEKAELRRLKISWEERISIINSRINAITSEISGLKMKRAQMSDELQNWIFRQYKVHNFLGEEASIQDIFSSSGLTPPGGTGDCAAPKLLEYAFRNGMKPIAMGEFWYGQSPETAVRTHGHFYPSCTSKCGPLLGWMMKGMDSYSSGDLCHDEHFHASGFDDHCSDGRTDDGPKMKIIYEDETLIAVDKPSGMPSVPGLDGRISAYEYLKKSYEELHTVHRLDMDTSGILLFAKTSKVAVELQKQFENQTIKKTYLARLSKISAGHTEHIRLNAGDRGRVELPLSPDYDERPRQKVDFAQGKPAITEYEVKSVNTDGTTDIIFHPLTGRTHQLRVHSAHTLGLARPILGDLLYGGADRTPHLHLRASALTFLHPTGGRPVHLHCP